MGCAMAKQVVRSRSISRAAASNSNPSALGFGLYLPPLMACTRRVCLSAERPTDSRYLYFFGKRCPATQYSATSVKALQFFLKKS